MNKPATKNRQPLASLDQTAAPLNGKRDYNQISVAAGRDIVVTGNVYINSDEAIKWFIDVINQQAEIINQQASRINLLTDKVISQTEELIRLKLKQNK